MNQIKPQKLLHSKWTAVLPQNKEKHFLVTEVDRNNEGKVVTCTIEAIMSKRTQSIQWEQLKDIRDWRQGWK